MAFQVTMSNEELVAWLKTKGLNDYPDDCTKLETKKINGHVFSKMRPEHLEKMGVSFAAQVLLEMLITEVNKSFEDTLQPVNPAEPVIEEVQYSMKQMAEDPLIEISQTDGPGVVSACRFPTKIWKGREVLLVYFLNPELLQRHGRLNVNKVLDWAKKWSVGDIPKFERTISPESADITVEFGVDGDCWSKVGNDAECMLPGEATMHLSLKGDYPTGYKSSKFLVIHEFGHSLGLEHEHQRSDFWRVISELCDIDSMKEDPRMKTFDWNMLEHPDSTISETSPYDSDSVMHYWFDVKWLKDEKQRTLQGVESDKKLTEKQKEILRGILKRNNKHVDRPSRADLELLKKHYATSILAKKRRESKRQRPSAAGPAPVDQAATTQVTTVNSGIVLSMSEFEKLSEEEVLKLVDDVTILDGDDLKDVIDYLDEVAGRWETISRNLRIKTGKINELVYSRQTPLNCLANAITDWLLLNYNHQRFGKPSWKKVAESVVKVNRKLFLRIALEHKAKGVTIVQESGQTDGEIGSAISRGHKKQTSNLAHPDHEMQKRIQATAQRGSSIVASNIFNLESLFEHFKETKQWKNRAKKLEIVVINGTTKKLCFENDHFDTGHWFVSPKKLVLQPGNCTVGFAANRPLFPTGVTGGMRWKIEGTTKFVVMGFTNPRIYRNKTYIQCTSDEKVTAKKGYRYTKDDSVKFRTEHGFIVSAMVQQGRKGADKLYEFIIAEEIAGCLDVCL